MRGVVELAESDLFVGGGECDFVVDVVDEAEGGDGLELGGFYHVGLPHGGHIVNFEEPVVAPTHEEVAHLVEFDVCALFGVSLDSVLDSVWDFLTKGVI